jgi:hypothetical protein
MKNLRSSYKCRIRDTLRNTPYGDVTELLPLMDVHEASCNNLFHGKLTGRSAFDTCPRLWPRSDVAAPLFSLVRPTRTDPYESLLHSLCESRFWNRSINTVPYDFCVSSPLTRLRGRVYGALTQPPLTEHLRRRTYGVRMDVRGCDMECTYGAVTPHLKQLRNTLWKMYGFYVYRYLHC